MPGVVQSDHRQTAVADMALELLRDGGRPYRVAVDATEDQVVVAVVGTKVRAPPAALEGAPAAPPGLARPAAPTCARPGSSGL